MFESKHPPVFEPAANEFICHYNNVRGYIRQQVIRHRLGTFLEDRQMVLDYGGGAALDSVWVTAHGSQADYWDDSSKMRLEATKNIKRSSFAIRMLESDPAEDLTSNSKYDLLMLHVVLQYIPPAITEILLPKLLVKLKPGGLLSMADRNWTTVEGSSEVKSFQNNLGLDCWVYPLNYWQQALNKFGFKAINARGVRSLTEFDMRPVSSVRSTELDDLLSAENAFSDNADSIENGRLLHILAVKQ